MNTQANSTTLDKPARTRSAPKNQQLLALLSRREGATITELTAALGLLPHSARAALTGLRKKGHSVLKGTRDGATCYSLVGASK
jgi:predicted ArsR family transcriptional regulator